MLKSIGSFSILNLNNETYISCLCSFQNEDMKLITIFKASAYIIKQFILG